jgi:hypothetical protein
VFGWNIQNWLLTLLDRLVITSVDLPKTDALTIDKLVMKAKSSKATIKATCQGYVTGDAHDKPFFTDSIQGKGEGQIILLHGPPGTGKTLMADMLYGHRSGHTF